MLEMGESVSKASGICYTDWSVNVSVAVPDINVHFTICLESERGGQNFSIDNISSISLTPRSDHPAMNLKPKS